MYGININPTNDNDEVEGFVAPVKAKKHDMVGRVNFAKL